MSDLDQSKVTGRQIAAARTLLGMNQPELAARARISLPTLKRMEASPGDAVGMVNNVASVRMALEAAGVEFTNGDQPGVRMRKGKPNG
jgi:transcriptional regulator with XRE-family HTH domain